MSELNKLEVINNKPELFKKFKKALERGRWLSASVVFCTDCIEVYLLPTENDNPENTKVETFIGYSEETLTALNMLLDTRAQFLKQKWLSHFQTLNESASEGWALDLSYKDYVILEDGATKDNLHRYYLDWSLKGLKEAAMHLSRRSNASLEDDDE